MLFNSQLYLFLFLPLTVGGYHVLARLGSFQLARIWLLLASFFFYSYWNIAYLPLLLSSIAVNYGIGRLLSKWQRGRRALLVLGIIANLGLLVYFKYSDFLLEILSQLGVSQHSMLNLVLPLAISFYTFQQIAYLVDCYRSEVESYDLAGYSLFVTFFPQLVAGPIVHHREMMPQFQNQTRANLGGRQVTTGLVILLVGLFKKIVIADQLALYADVGFSNPGELNVINAWCASLAYSLQLYFDFSAYSEMAIGAALMLGIRLPVNFNSPYKATSIQDFWRRWHMTLSRWLRDYVYIAVGGNRRNQRRTYANLLLTFVLGGIWHGAGWTFLLWGVLHGMAACVQHLWRRFGLPLPTVVCWILTLLFVNFAWVYFRADSIADANALISRMLLMGSSMNWQSVADTLHRAFMLPEVVSGNAIFAVTRHSADGLLLIAVCGFLALKMPNILELTDYKSGGDWVGAASGLLRPIVLGGLLFASLLVLFGEPSASEFIYFNF
jgi:alginate O-acetyltransferase complex protein AlgI